MPIPKVSIQIRNLPDFRLLRARALVGLGRVELPTSRLSGVRSNHLSYRPGELIFRKWEERETKTAALRRALARRAPEAGNQKPEAGKTGRTISAIRLRMFQAQK
jgi:hypothetical protein